MRTLLRKWLGIEDRASPENPTTSLANPDKWLVDWAGGTPTSSGARVTEDSALEASAVYAAVRVLTDTLAATPLVFYRRLERGKERATDHPLYRVLHDQANPEMSAFQFRETVQGHLATWGNGYAEIQTDNRGQVRALWPIPPHRVTVDRVGGQKVFTVQLPRSRVVLGHDRVLHIPGFGYDGLVGRSPIRYARESIGLSKAAEQFGAQWFGNGSRVAGVLKHPGRLSEKARDQLRKSWEEMHTGLSNAHRTAIIEEGMDWVSIGIPPEDAQFLQTRQFQVTEVARWFKVPPHKIMDLTRSTYSNIEQQSIEFVQDTMLPWFQRWEQTLWGSAVFSDRDREEHFAEFLVAGMLRGDSAARAAYYTAQFQVGAMSINDIREAENLNPVDGGDTYFVPANMTTLERALDPPRAVPVAEPMEEEEEEETGLRYVIEDVAQRCVMRELIQVRKALRDGKMREWAHGYYPRHGAYVLAALLPVCRAAFGAEAAHHAEALAAWWVDVSQRELFEVWDAGGDVEVRLAVWEAHRAREFTTYMLSRMAAGG